MKESRHNDLDRKNSNKDFASIIFKYLSFELLGYGSLVSSLQKQESGDGGILSGTDSFKALQFHFNIKLPYLIISKPRIGCQFLSAPVYPKVEM